MSAKWGWGGVVWERSLTGSGLLVDRGGGVSAGALGARKGVWAPHSVLAVGAVAGRWQPPKSPQPTRLCLVGGQAQNGRQAPSSSGPCPGPGSAHLHRALVPETFSKGRPPLGMSLHSPVSTELIAQWQGSHGQRLPAADPANFSPQPRSSKEPGAGTSTPWEGLTPPPSRPMEPPDVYQLDGPLTSTPPTPRCSLDPGSPPGTHGPIACTQN